MRLPSQKIHHVLTLLLAFSLPLDRRISPVLIALLMLNWLLDLNWKEKISNFRSNTIALLPLLLYLLYCLGMLYTENIRFGLKDLETKLSLLFFPLIFASKPALKKEDLHKILFYFTLGCGLAALICFGHSIYLYYDEIRQVQAGTLHDTYTNVNFFFSSQLSYFMHPSYFAMYLCMSIVYLISPFLNNDSFETIDAKYLRIMAVVFFSALIAFLASRMGIIVLAFILTGALLYIIINKKYYKAGFATLFILISACVLLYKNSQIIASRVDITLQTLSAKTLDKTSSESSAVRMLIWNQAIELIKENPVTGVGTGDIKDVLLEKYKSEGMTGAFERKLNAHNQFLQTGAALGLPALLLLLAVVFAPLWMLKHRHLLTVFFLLCVFLNFSVESMLEIQVGTVFFSFFYSILLIYKKDSTL